MEVGKQAVDANTHELKSETLMATPRGGNDRPIKFEALGPLLAV